MLLDQDVFMFFHSISPSTPPTDPRPEIQPSSTELAVPSNTVSSRDVKARPGVIIWVATMIAFFVVATFIAHAMNFTVGETVFLNLTVTLTSGAIGAFLGEKVAVDKLLK